MNSQLNADIPTTDPVFDSAIVGYSEQIIYYIAELML